MGTSLPQMGAAARPSSPVPRKHFALLEARGQTQPSLLSVLLMALCKAPSCSLSRPLPAGQDSAVTCTEPYLRWQNTGAALSSATSSPCPTCTYQKRGQNNGCAFTLSCAWKSRWREGDLWACSVPHVGDFPVLFH